MYKTDAWECGKLILPEFWCKDKSKMQEIEKEKYVAEESPFTSLMYLETYLTL